MTAQLYRDALCATGGKEFQHKQYIAIFREAFPRLRSEDDHGLAVCRRLLDEMKEARLIRFPSSGPVQHYGRLAFPTVISIVAARREKLVRPNIEWDARLALQASKANERSLHDLVRMNAYLQEMKVREPRLAPINARSLEIFGEEKRLKAKVVCEKSGRIFETLFLSDFRCYLPNEYYLTYTAYGSSATTALIVENSETFHIMKQRNRARPDYRAVVHGRGKEILKGFQCLPEMAAELGVTRFEYFGDIDVPGFEMPIRASASLREMSSFAIHPALDLYEECLSGGRPQAAAYSDDYDPMKSWGLLKRSVETWLEDRPALYPLIEDVLQSNRRVAQEWVY